MGRAFAIMSSTPMTEDNPVWPSPSAPVEVAGWLARVTTPDGGVRDYLAAYPEREAALGAIAGRFGLAVGTSVELIAPVTGAVLEAAGAGPGDIIGWG